MSDDQKIAVVDIGGTHARFAIAHMAEIDAITVKDVIKMRVDKHASLQLAWEAYADQIGQRLPKEGAIALAAPIHNDVMQLTNSSWIIQPSLLSSDMKLDRFTLVNDFGAAAHAIAGMEQKSFTHICGPQNPLNGDGLISVVGPGTGLGVAHLQRNEVGYRVTQTEGGHIDFAPLDILEDKILNNLRQQYQRVSVERVVSGPGLQNIYQSLADLEGLEPKRMSDQELWQNASNADDPLAAAALGRFCMCFGAIAGDLVLAQGANNLVITGGLASRFGERLLTSGFQHRFVAKGRFQSHMENIGVYLAADDDLGLKGAAAAFIQEHQ
ncbi:MAG: glucokinase [Parasphingorhabdus sp.]